MSIFSKPKEAMVTISLQEYEELQDSCMSLNQLRNTAEIRVKVMTLLRTNEGLETAAQEVADQIDDLLVQTHTSMSQRNRKITNLVREQMRRMLEGEKHWKTSNVYLRAGLDQGKDNDT